MRAYLECFDPQASPRRRGSRSTRSPISGTLRKGKHRQVDDRPFGGGAGHGAHAGTRGRRRREDARKKATAPEATTGAPADPAGRAVQRSGWLKNLAAGPGMILVSGRYEGFDERIRRSDRSPKRFPWGTSCWPAGSCPPWPSRRRSYVCCPACWVTTNSPPSKTILFRRGFWKARSTRGRESSAATSVPEVLVSGNHARNQGMAPSGPRKTRTRERRRDLTGRLTPPSVL